MHEAQPRRSTRATGPGERRAGLPVQRSRRDAHPSGVGWWQPPRNQPPKQAQRKQGQRKQGQRDRVPAPGGWARHRVPEATEVLPVALAPARPPRFTRRRSRGPRSAHHRPPTAAEQRARRLRLLRRTLIGTAATVVLGPMFAFVVGYLAFPVPSPDDAVNNQVALVSFADGSPLTRLVPEEGNRIKVSIDQVPMHVRHAVLAAEDRSFYSNPGFDLTGIARAAWNQLRGGEGGGSTITQQFVKKALVGD
ncbi:MAG TPA: biosynthetic peptidoglycan transglycosylase, partial [Pseudonocardia sp.]|nr:biosynthetic peptidoglycan transglycosylase [Pseudonocardia sp.]